MKTEKEKMLAGELYDPFDETLSAERRRTRDLCQALNETRGAQVQARTAIIRELFATATDVWIQPPFFCDYGTNITVGEKVFFNFNCVVLDVMPVTIGSHTLLGPAVQIYTATHPLDAAQRRNGLEFARPVEIGRDVWIGGGAIICPGVSIGDGAVIGAGSVVTRDIPVGMLAAGNPCRVLRTLTE